MDMEQAVNDARIYVFQKKLIRIRMMISFNIERLLEPRSLERA